MSQKIGTGARLFPGIFHYCVSILTLMIDVYRMAIIGAKQSHVSAASLTETFVHVTVRNISEYFGR
jgi:hypothetical protein